MHFGHAGLIESSDEEDVPAEEDREEDGAVEETKTGKAKEMSNLVSAELVFPFKSIPLVIAGIPKYFLPLSGPKVQSHYHCQVPQCGLDFAQKAAACNHVWHDHLNVALACLYCNFEDNPKMHSYSATALENHTAKHHKDNFRFFQMRWNLLKNSSPSLTVLLPPALQNSCYPMKMEIIKWVQAGKCFCEEEQATLVPLVPKKKGLKLSAFEQQTAPSP